MKHNLFTAVFAIIAIAASVVLFSAFKAQPLKSKAAVQWFQYDGSGDIHLSSSYEAVGSTSPGCEGTSAVCAIRAEESTNPDQPQITSQLIEQIDDALANPSVSQENVELKN